MFDSERVLNDLKALDILAIARDLGREPNRQNLIHCTFHDENTPSMKLNPKTNRFKCFGCGESGSTIDLYASAGKGMQFADAVKEMKSRYLGIIDGQLPQPQRLARPVPTKIERPVVPAEEFSPVYSALQTFCRQHPQPSRSVRHWTT